MPTFSFRGSTHIHEPIPIEVTGSVHVRRQPLEPAPIARMIFTHLTGRDIDTASVDWAIGIDSLIIYSGPGDLRMNIRFWKEKEL
jgi:hypothetical protein